MTDLDAEQAFLQSMQDDSATATPALNGTTPQKQQPKTIGGFIDDDEEDDDEEYDPVASIQEKEITPAINVNGGDTSAPQQSLPQSPAIADVPQPSVNLASTQEPSITTDPVPENDVPVPSATPQIAGDANGVQSPVNVQAASAPSDEVAAAPTMADSTSSAQARLPHDRIGILEDRIRDDPRGDIDAWLMLIVEHKKRNKLDEARNVYDRFFAIFPHAVSDCSMPLSFILCLHTLGRPMGGVHQHGAGRERLLPC